MPASDPLLALSLALAETARQRLRKRRRTPARPRARDEPPRLSPSQRRGLAFEDEALALLLRHGLAPLARNVRTQAGEIDLVMRDGPVLVLVEVRARASSRYGGAGASIDRAKQARLARAAALLLPRLAAHWHGRTPPVRFDAVLFEDGRPQWIRNAFSPEEGSR